jgi:hypothetical protein
VPDQGPARSPAASRTHVVLVPGFVGFDALGQLENYAGVTDVFQRVRGDKDAPARLPHETTPRRVALPSSHAR